MRRTRLEVGSLCVCVSVCSVTRRAIEHDREVEGETRQEKRSDRQEIKHERRPDEINKRQRNLCNSAPKIQALQAAGFAAVETF